MYVAPPRYITGNEFTQIKLEEYGAVPATHSQQTVLLK